jgi:DNA repair protein RadC
MGEYGGIVNWPEADRPREKLLKNGAHSLSDSELMAILFRTGSKGESAVDLARKVLAKFGSFRNMSHTDCRDWNEFKGLGKAKIAQIKAALEIANRLNGQESKSLRQTFIYSEEIVRQFKSYMLSRKTEQVKVLLCDSKNRLIEAVDIAQGTPTECHPIIREVVSQALQKYASGLVCLHNHPGGDSTPSREDEFFTENLKQASRVMGLRFLDHIIFGEENCYSFDKQAIINY